MTKKEAAAHVLYVTNRMGAKLAGDVIEGDPPCPCDGCEKARAAFKANLEPLPEVSRG